MIIEYRCENCGQLLFRAAIRFLLSKKRTGGPCIESKCERCGKMNRFVYDPNRQVEKRQDSQPAPS